MNYRPLPDFLEIRVSDIDGYGLFTKEILGIGENLGITHMKNKDFEDGRIRTPLGGFVNHSENPNCEFVKQKDRLNRTDFPVFKEGVQVHLVTLRDIRKGEELFSKYWLYSIGGTNGKD